MSTTMTMAEWREHLKQMAARVNAEWPELRVETDRSLIVRCPDRVCEGQLALRIAEVGSKTTMVPEAYIGSGTALGGTAHQLLHGARRYQRLAEALLCVEHLSNGIVVT